MSYNNLSIYDRSLLNNVKNIEKIYLCNTKLEFENFEKTIIKKIYNYSDKKGILKILSYVWSQLLFLLFFFKNNIDLIHVQWIKLPYFDYFLYKTLKKILKVKIIFTAHNILPHDTGLKYKNIYKRIYTIADKIIVHSLKTKEEIVNEFEISEDKIKVIHHGLLDIKKDSVGEEKLNIRKGDEKIYSFIGYLNEYKGIDFLVDAWKESEILKNNKGIRLIIAGKGNVDFKGIEEIENVTIINRFLEDFELDSIIKETDLFILPYRKISQSGVLLSILNERKPILVSGEGGLTDPFEFGKVGWIMEEKSSKNLKACLEKISFASNELEAIKKNDDIWQKIADNYDWQKIGEKTEKLYEEVIK